MKEIDDLNLPNDLKYSNDHEWAKANEDGTVTIGISDYAQDQLGEIVFVELPEVDDSFEFEEEFGSVESVKAVSEILMPLSGTIIAVNEALEDAPELVNESCYDKGWLVRVKPDDAGQLDDLLDKEAYLAMLKG